jgi:hypothetical protein
MYLDNANKAENSALAVSLNSYDQFFYLKDYLFQVSESVSITPEVQRKYLALIQFLLDKGIFVET